MPAACIWLIKRVRLASVVPVFFIFSETLWAFPTVLHQNGMVSATRSPLAITVAVPGASSQYGSQPVMTGNAGVLGATSVIGATSAASLATAGMTNDTIVARAAVAATQILGLFILVLRCCRFLDIADRLEIFADLDSVPKLCHIAQLLVYQLLHFPQYLLS